MLDDTQFIRDVLSPMQSVGAALHWLHPKSKRPIGDKWSSVPVASLDDLIQTYQSGNNLGVRLGMPSSLVDGSYLHVLDIDIRDADQADEAWARVNELFDGVDLSQFPTVVSGSGGASRHVYFVTSKPFYSKRLIVSDGKHRSPDGKWHYDYEAELFGTGKQVVLPPSIHPDTGKPYTWDREFDFDLLSMGVGPTIDAARLEEIATAESSTYEFENRPPLTFKEGQIEAELDLIPVSDLHYDDWIRLGQALHHQYGGSEYGVNLWIQHSKRSKKFTGDAQIREMRRSKWRSFGRYRGQPVTMATVRQWAIDQRHENMLAQFDDVDDFDDATSAPAADADPLDDLLGTPSPPVDDLDSLIDGAVSLIDGAVSNTSTELDWKSLLDFNEEGAIRPTLANISLIVMNDLRLVGVPQLNEFTHETVQRTTPRIKSSQRKNAAKPTLQLEGKIWQVNDKVNGELWSDDRDFAIRRAIEAPKTQGGYGLKLSDRDLKAAIVIAANNAPFHPIREYLDAQKWDGKPRAEGLFIDYMGADDCQYHRDIARMMLVAAVTRIYEPGHKFDFAVIIEGVQGKRKSTFIETLGQCWFAELDGDFHDQKAMIELMQGAWIMEIPELSGFNRGDVRSIKAFISRKKDRARLAYARRAGEFPRQVVFIGSTNDREYLKDDTGGRRFWPCICSATEINIEHLETQVDQIWAEAVHLYNQMREVQPYGTLPLYLANEDSRITAARLQESRRVESADDALRGQIEAWLNKPIADGGFDDIDDQGEPRYRDETCLVEIWCDCLMGDRKTYDQTKAQMLGRTMSRMPDWYNEGDVYSHPRYGRQRVYRRGGLIGTLQRQTEL